jgi:hypothetical protein
VVGYFILMMMLSNRGGGGVQDDTNTARYEERSFQMKIFSSLTVNSKRDRERYEGYFRVDDFNVYPKHKLLWCELEC